MVATEHERHRAARGDLLHDRREARTGVEDLRQEAGALVLDRKRLGLRCQDVPAVDDRASERREPLLESGIADRGRPHVDAAAALPEIEGRADDRHGTGRGGHGSGGYPAATTRCMPLRAALTIG